VRPGRVTIDFVEGAMTTMLVLKRLAALAAVAAVMMVAGLAIGDAVTASFKPFAGKLVPFFTKEA